MKERKAPWWFRRKEEHPIVRQAADYTVISAVGLGIAGCLRMHMVPGMLSGEEDIGLCTPAEHGNIRLGICLYDMKESEEIRVNGMQPLDEEHLQYPPMYLSLYYMITAYSDSDLRFRAEEEQRILGMAMQVLYDNPILDGDTMLPAEGDVESESDLHLEYLNLPLNKKNEVWTAMGTQSRLSLFYRAAPVKLESGKKKKISRVKEIITEYLPKTPGGGGQL